MSSLLIDTEQLRRATLFPLRG